MVKENSSEIGFEKQIWDAADELRGSMDALQKMERLLIML